MKKRFTFLIAAFALLTMLCQPNKAVAQASVGTTMWAEDFSYYVANDVPSGTIPATHTGTTIYNNGTVTYSVTNGGTTSKIYDANLAGGESPELLISKGGGTFSIADIPTGGATELTLTYKTNNGNNAISTTTSNVVITEGSSKAETKTFTIEPNGVGTFTLVVTNSNTANTRVDDFSIVVKTAGGTITNTHTLTFGPSSSLAGTVTVGSLTSPATVAEGATYNITATSNLGFVFSNWSVTGTGSSVADATSATTTFIMGTTDATLTANYTQVPTYTVTYYPNVAGTAPIEMDYNEGEDVTVANNTFSNPGNAFTKWNTAENGSGDDYMPGDVIANIDDDMDLYAQWEASNDVVDVLDWAATGSPTNYSDWTYTAPSGTAYKGQSSGNSTGQYIQLRSNNNNSGIVTTSSIGNVTKVVVAWNSSTYEGRTLNIYGKNTAYSAATDLYGNDAGDLLGTIVCGTSTELNITGSYAFIGMRSAANAMYLDEIDITWNASSTPAPSFTIDNNDEIAYNATDGSFTFTVNNPVPNGQVYVSEDVDWISNAGLSATTNNMVVFNTTVNEDGASRSGIITLTYSYDNENVTKDVTVTQSGNPNIVNNISDITEVGANYHVKGMVVAINSRGFVIGDGTGYVYTYMNGTHNYTVGDNMSITGTTGSYGHIIQFTNSATIEPVTQTNYNGDPQYTVITEVPDYSQGYHLSDYFQFEGPLTSQASGNYTNYYIALGQNSICISYPTTDQQNEMEALVNKTVRVHGFFAGISSSTGFTVMMESIEEVTTPAEPIITVASTEVNVDAEAHEGTIDVTYTNVDTEYAEVMLCDANGGQANYNWIQSFLNNEHNVYYNISANDGEARTAYLKVCDNINNPTVFSQIITINQAAYVAPSVATLPFEFNGPKADIENTEGLTAEGLGSDYSANTAPNTQLKFDGTGDWLLLQFDQAPGTLTFNIKGNSFSGSTFTVQTSEDGVTYTDLKTYTDTELGTTAVLDESFDNLDQDIRYIKWIYTEKVSGGGNVGLGNIHLYNVGGGPVIEPTIVVEPAEVNATASLTEGTLTVTYNNMDVNDYSINVIWSDATGEPLPNGYEWITWGFDNNMNVYYTINANDGDARTAYMNVIAQNATTTTVINSNLVTINQAAYVPSTGAIYTLATSIENGRHYIITNGSDKAMGGQNNNNRAAVDITTTPNGVQGNANVVELVINGPDANGFYTIYDANEPGYLYAAGASSSNYLRTETFCDNRGQWTITFNAESGTVSIIANITGDNPRNVMRYNSQGMFSCYGANNTQADIYLYMKNESAPEYNFYKDIAGYGDATNSGGYYFIASPVGDLNPTNVPGMVDGDGDFDLYRFDEASINAEWQNYKANNFILEKGRGYLYAHSTTVTLHLTGTPNQDETVTLTKTAGAALEGWNLVGNPFAQTAYIDRDFYVLNEDGSEVMTNGQNRAIAPMEGVFVMANSDGEQMTFTTQNPAGTGAKLVMNLSGNRGNVIDRAIVRFGESNSLPKFQINPNNTKIYITRDNNDYAVVSSEENGEMPVSFKADTDGSYTISFNTEDTDFSYLHLVDNMTGNDVDLLTNPSYSFDAQTNDYASRFKLVFAKNTTGLDEQFAFINNGNLVVNGNGTLQIVDMMGRIVSTNSTNDHINTNGMAAGVYVLRLVNGDNVKTQKIVVE